MKLSVVFIALFCVDFAQINGALAPPPPPPPGMGKIPPPPGGPGGAVGGVQLPRDFTPTGSDCKAAKVFRPAEVSGEGRIWKKSKGRALRLVPKDMVREYLKHFTLPKKVLPKKDAVVTNSQGQVANLNFLGKRAISIPVGATSAYSELIGPNRGGATTMKRDKFEDIWDVVMAVQSHDDRLVNVTPKKLEAMAPTEEDFEAAYNFVEPFLGGRQPPNNLIEAVPRELQAKLPIGEKYILNISGHWRAFHWMIQGLIIEATIPESLDGIEKDLDMLIPALEYFCESKEMKKILLKIYSFMATMLAELGIGKLPRNLALTSLKDMCDPKAVVVGNSQPIDLLVKEFQKLKKADVLKLPELAKKYRLSDVIGKDLAFLNNDLNWVSTELVKAKEKSADARAKYASGGSEFAQIMNSFITKHEGKITELKTRLDAVMIKRDIAASLLDKAIAFYGPQPSFYAPETYVQELDKLEMNINDLARPAQWETLNKSTRLFFYEINSFAKCLEASQARIAEGEKKALFAAQRERAKAAAKKEENSDDESGTSDSDEGRSNTVIKSSKTTKPTKKATKKFGGDVKKGSRDALMESIHKLRKD
jgi:hypothetical protein